MFFALPKKPNSSKEVDVSLCKLKWSDDKRALFEQNLNLPENLSETERGRRLIDVDVNNNNNNVHLSCAHQRPERSHDTY